MTSPQTLSEFLARNGGRKDVRDVITALSKVAADLAIRVARGALEGPLGTVVGEGNSDGDAQKALDMLADEAFATALSQSQVRWFASEERDEAASFNQAGTLAVAIDPLDGSSNIDVNVSIGTIFSIYPAEADAASSFLRPGRDLLASGYFIYGPQTALVVTLGAGSMQFILDPDSGTFLSAGSALDIPRASREFAINASNYRFWPKPVRAYIDDCIAGEEGPREKNFNMRWVASLVAETHRILMRGGIFLYPADSRESYQHGRLRMVYECAPIALLIEQAGGAATDGADRILDIVPDALHARTPFVFGSTEKVARVAAYHDLPDAEVSPLFARRGLFRA